MLVMSAGRIYIVNTLYAVTQFMRLPLALNSNDLSTVLQIMTLQQTLYTASF